MERSRLPNIIIVFLLLSIGIVPTNSRGQFLDHSGDSAFHSPRNADEHLLYDLNHLGEGGHCFDGSMLFVSQSVMPLAIAMPVGLVISGLSSGDNSISGYTIAASTVVTIGLQEFILKPIAHRLRPFHTIAGVRRLDSAASGYSFPSSHSAISWGLAVGLSLRFPKWYVIAPSALYALVVSFSRPCLGVHYPTDVLAGAIVGSAVQYLGYVVQQKITKKTEHFVTTTAKPFQPASFSIVLPIGQ